MSADLSLSATIPHASLTGPRHTVGRRRVPGLITRGRRGARSRTASSAGTSSARAPRRHRRNVRAVARMSRTRRKGGNPVLAVRLRPSGRDGPHGGLRVHLVPSCTVYPPHRTAVGTRNSNASLTELDPVRRSHRRDRRRHVPMRSALARMSRARSAELESSGGQPRNPSDYPATPAEGRMAPGTPRAMSLTPESTGSLTATFDSAGRRGPHGPHRLPVSRSTTVRLELSRRKKCRPGRTASDR